MRRLTALFAVMAAFGCKKAETTCEQVVDNMLVVTKEQVLRSGGTPSKKNLIAECERRKLTPTQKACMAKAVDLEQLAGCTGLKPQTPRDRSGYEPVGGGGGTAPPHPDQHRMTDDPHSLPLGHPALTPGGRGAGSGSNAGS